MYCRKCGRELSEDTKFCPKCGTSIEVTAKKNEIVKNGATENPKLKPGLIVGILLFIALIVCIGLFSKEKTAKEPIKEKTIEKEENKIELSTLDAEIETADEEYNVEEVIKAYEDYLNTVGGYDEDIYYMFYLNDDAIPELIIETYDENKGALFLSYLDGEINTYNLKFGIVDYIEKQNKLKLTHYYGICEDNIIFTLENNNLVENHFGHQYKGVIGGYEIDGESMHTQNNYMGTLNEYFDSEIAKSIHDIPIADSVPAAYKVLQEGITSDSIFNKKTIKTFDYSEPISTRGYDFYINDKRIKTFYYDNSDVSSDNIIRYTDYKYDDNDLLIEKVITYTDNYFEPTVIKYEYENGILVKEKKDLYDTSIEVPYSIEYEYNNQGYIVKCSYVYPDSEGRNCTILYSYENMTTEVFNTFTGETEEREPRGNLLVTDERYGYGDQEHEINSVSDYCFVIPDFVTTKMWDDLR